MPTLDISKLLYDIFFTQYYNVIFLSFEICILNVPMKFDKKREEKMFIHLEEY